MIRGNVRCPGPRLELSQDVARAVGASGHAVRLAELAQPERAVGRKRDGPPELGQALVLAPAQEVSPAERGPAAVVPRVELDRVPRPDERFVMAAGAEQ